MVKQAGGEVKGDLRYPFPDTTDFSVFSEAGGGERRQGAGVCQRRRRHAELHQAGAEFGLNKTMKIAPLLLFMHDVHSLGLTSRRG